MVCAASGAKATSRLSLQKAGKRARAPAQALTEHLAASRKHLIAGPRVYKRDPGPHLLWVSQTSDAEYHLPIEGMTCNGCAARLSKQLAAVPGVRSAEAHYATREAVITGDDVDLTALREATERAGFELGSETTRLNISGMSCSNCALGLTKRLMEARGVLRSDVSFATGTALVEYVPGLTDVGALAEVVRGAGYDIGDASSVAKEEQEHELRDLGLSALLTLPLLLPMFVMPLGLHWALPGELQLLLAAPVQFLFGARFYRGAYFAVKNRSGNMDVLVAVGTSAAFGVSVFELMGGGHDLYFEASTAVITFVRLGKWLEGRAKRGTLEALTALMSLQPKTARVMRGKVERELPSELVVVGDHFVVRPGESVPVDGRILSGETELNLAQLTGESLPVAKGPGALVPSGAINGTGLLQLQAVGTVKDSALARVVNAVQSLSSGKAKTQRLVDRASALFVPVLMAIALATFVGSLAFGVAAEGALLRAVAVLVIACPCALGLATPTALMAGSGAAARAGILIRDPAAVEVAGRIDHVAFDKTGTLTQGKPALDDIWAEGDEKDALALASALQRGSEHPLAKAFLSAAKAQGLSLPSVAEFRAVPGRGVQALAEGHPVQLGSLAWMLSQGVDLEAVGPAIEHTQQAGKTLVVLTRDGRAIAGFGLTDPLHEGAAEAIAQLKARGIAVSLLSGDRRAAAERIAHQLGIAEVEAEQLPEDKAQKLIALRDAGATVAMVGDGVNDAPAMAAAALGISVSGSSDIAVHASGISLMRPDPRLVPAALEIARRLQRTIAENLFWAFFYNCAAIPLAALGRLSPALAGLAMAMSSVTVMLNSLRLRAWKPKIDS